MTEQQITYLIIKQLYEDLTPEEVRILEEWIANSPAHQLLLEDFTDPDLLARFLQANHETNAANSIARIRDRVNLSIQSGNKGRIVHRIHFLRRSWFRYAAAILVIVGIGTYLWNKQQKEKPVITQTNSSPVKNDIMPGKDRALLTLSDGRQIELNNAASETINDGTLSIENNNGRLIYKKGDRVAMNTMTTPKGGQYKITLADGTKVWLNAASSITYPTAFTGQSREVAVTGEVYFEVAQNKEKPFIVKTAKDEITVLGTSFNVNAYPDEPASKISLIDGAIKVNKEVLKPGQAYRNGKIIPTDTKQDIAWKNGIFNFNNVDLATAMNQIARWYDVNVIYEDEVPRVQFGGEMGRDLNLGQTLKALEAMGVRFTINGRNLIVKNRN